MKKFFNQFIKHPKEVGSAVPCSKSMVKKLLSKVDFAGDFLIAEFWAWPWNYTKEILNKMSKWSVLYSFEILEELYKISSQINDQRLVMINDWAENLESYVEWSKVDIIISWLPLASLPESKKEEILQAAYKNLKQGWIFLQYQYFLSNKKDIKRYFWDYDLYFHLLNIPPAFFYKCKK